MSNIIDDVLEWSPTLALSGMMESKQTIVNVTESDSNFAGRSKTDPDGEATPVETGVDSASEQHEAEATENQEETDQHKHHDHI